MSCVLQLVKGITIEREPGFKFSFSIAGSEKSNQYRSIKDALLMGLVYRLESETFKKQIRLILMKLEELQEYVLTSINEAKLIFEPIIQHCARELSSQDNNELCIEYKNVKFNINHVSDYDLGSKSYVVSYDIKSYITLEDGTVENGISKCYTLSKVLSTIVSIFQWGTSITDLDELQKQTKDLLFNSIQSMCDMYVELANDTNLKYIEQVKKARTN